MRTLLLVQVAALAALLGCIPAPKTGRIHMPRKPAAKRQRPTRTVGAPVVLRPNHRPDVIRPSRPADGPAMRPVRSRPTKKGY